MHTFSYKGWYIHINLKPAYGCSGVKVTSPEAYTFHVKSVHAAKCFITRRLRGYR
jgi:hypothetical protein